MILVLIIFAFISCPVKGLTPPNKSSEMSSRRKLLKDMITSQVGLLVVGLPNQSAHAARGAAELDFEFYMRDLMGGNKKEGNIVPSTPPPITPPRTLKGPLLPMLLNNDCTTDCIPVQVLIQEIQKQSSQQSTSRNVDSIAKDIQQRVNDTREKTRRSFYAKSPWKEEDISDQYYFDFTAYALWKTAAELLPNNLDRDRFVRNIGRTLVNKLQNDFFLTVKPGNDSSKYGSLVASNAAIIEYLELLKTAGFCKDYRIRATDDIVPASKNEKSSTSIQVFDELDDESIDLGGTVDCLVSVYEPASLGASLQINGEQSRFGPDFVGTALAAIWEQYGGIKSSWEFFFVDAEYRPNPKDYFPNEQLLQFTLVKKKQQTVLLAT